MNSAVRVIQSSMKLHMKQSFSRPTFKFIVLLQPLLYSVLFYFMFKNSHNINIGEYIIIGTGVLNLWSSIVFSSASDIERERYMGTLEVIYSTPSDFRIIFLGKVLGNLVLGLFSMIVSYLSVTLIFKLEVAIINPIGFIIAIILTVASFSIISILMAYLFTLSRNSRMLMNTSEYPIYILCGVVFPIEILPYFIQPLSYLLSPTWGVKILRQSMSGIDDYSVFFTDMLWLITLSLMYLVLVLLLNKKVDYATRINGNLGVH